MSLSWPFLVGLRSGRSSSTAVSGQHQGRPPLSTFVHLCSTPSGLSIASQSAACNAPDHDKRTIMVVFKQWAQGSSRGKEGSVPRSTEYVRRPRNLAAPRDSQRTLFSEPILRWEIIGRNIFNGGIFTCGIIDCMLAGGSSPLGQSFVEFEQSTGIQP